MFYFMSKGDFDRVSAIVEVINGKSYLLPSKDSEKILSWVNECKHEVFDQFCLEVSEYMLDNGIALDDYEGIANEIHETLKEWQTL